MKDVTKRLKEHVWCIVIGAAIVLIGFVVLAFGGKGNEIVSYVSFAAAICSIILAVIAIFISIVQHSSSQQNRGEIRNLVEQASKVMGEKADKVSQEAQSIENIAKQLMETTVVEGEEKVEPQDIQLQPEITRIVLHILIIFYCLGKSYDYSKYIPARMLAEALFPKLGDTGVTFGFVVGVVVYLGCLWGHKNIDMYQENGETICKANKIPKGLREDALKEINRRMASPEFQEEYKERLVSGRNKIDAYFEAA